MPKYTNDFDLPDPLFNALVADNYDRDTKANYSVTELVSPVRIVILKRRHADKITADASENLWSLLGSSIHYILENAATEDDIVEQRFRIKLKAGILSGKSDLFEVKHGIINDFKVTSVYSFLLGTKEEWEQQVNLNAMLFRSKGYDVKKGRIIAILRDWVKTKSLHERTYPQRPFHSVWIPLWDQMTAKNFAGKRMRELVKSESIADDKLPICTPEQRWLRGEAYAVKKIGNKKATAVCDTQEKAEQAKHELEIARPKDSFEIEHRHGINVRCEEYCPVNKFCSFYKNVVTQQIKERNKSAE